MLTAGILAIVVTSMGISEPAHASGGGCVTKTKSGWNVGVCTHDDGVWAYGDFYINSKPNSSATCSLTTMWFMGDSGNVTTPFPSSPCFLGQHLAVDKYYIRGKNPANPYWLQLELWGFPGGRLYFDNHEKPTHCC